MFRYTFRPYTLRFRSPAGTSRGVLTEKTSWFLRLWHTGNPECAGWGEAGLLPGLSPENEPTFETDARAFLDACMPMLGTGARNRDRLSAGWLESWPGPWLPSVVFALETAWLDWYHGGKRLICDSLFHSGNWEIPINGLVWMNPAQTMESEALQKQAAGFQTLKFKVGALEWKEERALLGRLREHLPADRFAFRLDANGAWTEEEALARLESLAVLEIESLEQPVAPGQPHAMARICRESPIPIALDEELRGLPGDAGKYGLLEAVNPAFIVLKPTLLGGMGQTHQWIQLAEDMGIGWWITSMLESNLGLNAIAQLSAGYRPVLAQGLGTGQIYLNNLPSPLAVAGGHLAYDPAKQWDLSVLETGNPEE